MCMFVFGMQKLGECSVENAKKESTAGRIGLYLEILMGMGRALVYLRVC